ncbi:MAG: hypothetical protein J1F05_04830 [Muribaculaceae bacterium]|nr:hypothetical protein [Muribaculaceae bacterium]
MDKELIQQLFANNNLTEASLLLKAGADDNDPWALYMLGRIAWKEGRKSDAISLYTAAANIDSSSEAAVALEQTRDIMDFYNKDLYNP